MLGGLNTYAYVNGNSLSYNDPLGLMGSRGSPANHQPYKGDGPLEGFSQIINVGPIDAFRANLDAGTAFAETENSELGGIRNGPADGYRHCVWSCLMTQHIGFSQAKQVGDVHEVQGDKHKQPTNEREMDQWNNAIGRQCGQLNDNKSCPQRCMDALTNGSLQLKLKPMPIREKK